MSQQPREPEHLLESLLSDTQPQPDGEPVAPDGDEDVDALLDALEALVAESRRMPFRKLLVDEDRLMGLLDRLRAAVPEEVRQAHQLLDQHDQILDAARREAQEMLEERGLVRAMETQRRRLLDEAEDDAERIRTEADRYARSVLVDLDERLDKLKSSVRNGIDALGTETEGA